MEATRTSIRFPPEALLLGSLVPAMQRIHAGPEAAPRIDARKRERDGCGSQRKGSHFGGFVNSPILEPILVVGLNRMFTGG